MSEISDAIVNIASYFVTIILIGVMCIVFSALMQWFDSMDKPIDDSKWNNGYCTCGGEWVYSQAVGHRRATRFLYECDKCGETYEFLEKR